MNRWAERLGWLLVAVGAVACQAPDDLVSLLPDGWVPPDAGVDVAQEPCDGSVPGACEDDDPWTEDACLDGRCYRVGRLSDGFPCGSSADCPQAGAFCASRCDPGSGACVPDTSGRVCGCAADDDCDDRDRCTVDRCFTGFRDDQPLWCCGICEADRIPGCCRTASDCDDAEPCTEDLCDVRRGCLHNPQADGVPCDDRDPATTGEACRGGVCASPGA